MLFRSDRNGLGLVIGLSKKSSNPDKKQVVFIRALQRRADGTQSEAVRKGEMMPQDVVEAVNGVEVGTDLSVLTKEINKVDIDGPITFRVSRRAKDEERRLKALADQKIALKLNYQLRTIFNMIDTDKSNSLTLAEIDAAGKQIFLDKLGIHLPADIIKNGFASLEQFAEIGDGKISFEEFRGVLYSKELALSSRNTRYAKYAILFKTLDKDASGSIDKDEFLGANDMMKKLFGENGDSIVEEFASADLNNDGQISFEELRNIAEDFYERHLHPDGYEEADSISLTHEEATALIDEHYDEDHTDTVGTPEHLAEIGSVVESAAAAATAAAAAAAAATEGEAGDGESAAEPVVSEALAKAQADAKAAEQEAADKKEAEDQQKHKEELAAAKKQKEIDNKLKAEKEEQRRKDAAAAAEEKESAAAAPAKAGCCVIA